MSTILNTNGTKLKIPALVNGVAGKFYIITAEWNREITHALCDGAVSALREAGIQESRIICMSVPGTVELVNAAALCLNKASSLPGSGQSGATEAVIMLGCVVRGDTPHFDYVCSIAADGAARLNSIGTTPVLFGVLTVENMQQAKERAGGKLGNKGAEAAVAAVEMANLHAVMRSHDSL